MGFVGGTLRKYNDIVLWYLQFDFKLLGKSTIVYHAAQVIKMALEATKSLNTLLKKNIHACFVDWSSGQEN